jgi:hypothetical protein
MLPVTVLALPLIVPDDVAPDGPAREEPTELPVVAPPPSPPLPPGDAPGVGWEPQAATMRAAHKPMSDASFMRELRSSGARCFIFASRPDDRRHGEALPEMSGPPPDQTVS